MKKIFYLLICISSITLAASEKDLHQYTIVESISAKRIERDITKLAGFGTRHTLSETQSKTRGIGAARRWIRSKFNAISQNCHNCLKVFFQKDLVKKGTNSRITKDVWVVNVAAVQKGTQFPNSYIIMSGDIDSRVSDPNDYSNDSPGANDNASGMAGTIEVARVLSQFQFAHSIIYLGLSGEEQGLFGGKGFAQYAKDKGWDIVGILNNDMIGNIKGVSGAISNRDFRIFSEPTPVTETTEQRKNRRFYGGEIDGHSRQLARYVYTVTHKYMPEMNPILIYRLDRFGRGGHHRPFNDAGFAGIRIMEAHENYTQQHQDIRTENNIEYGDKLKFVDFNYAAKLSAVNAITLAHIASAPPTPKHISIGGMVKPAVTLKWQSSPSAIGYKIVWRDTTSPTWQYSRFVGNVTEYTLDQFVIDNYLFAIVAVNAKGYESIAGYPTSVFR